MVLINAEVNHGTFGSGTITAQENGIVTVRFSEEIGVKRFQYPTAFISFLTFTDSTRQTEVSAELKRLQEAKLAEQREQEAEAAEKKERERLAALDAKRAAVTKNRPAAKPQSTPAKASHKT